MPGRIEFEFPLSRPGQNQRRVDTQAMRILVMGDFSGRGQTGAAAPALSERPIPAVDVDNFEAVMTRLAPHLDLPLPDAPGTSAALDFGSLDDFHPDALYGRLDLFKGLRELRSRLLDPATFQEAAAHLRETARVRTAEAAPSGEAPAAAGDEDDTSTFARLLGGSAGEAPGRTTARSLASDFISQVVAPHIVAEADPMTEVYVRSVDETISAQMRALLQHRAFRDLESAWRGIHALVTGVETGEELRLYLLDVTRAELLADFAGAGTALDRSGLYTRLVEKGPQQAGGEPWSLLVCDFTFGTAAADILLLAGLGGVASQAGGPVLAAAAPQVLGLTTLDGAPDPRDWPVLSTEDAARWQALRTSPVAPWIGLVLPRILSRLPYGPDTEEVEGFEFRELLPAHDHETLAWGNPAFACAGLIAGAFVEAGWAMQPGDRLDVEDLPAYTFTADGESHLQACAEIYLSERAAEAVLARGVMPLMSYRNRNAARLLRFQSVAEPATELAGPWGN